MRSIECSGSIGGFKSRWRRASKDDRSPRPACIGTTCEPLRPVSKPVGDSSKRVIGTLGMVKDQVARTAVDLYAKESVLYLTTGSTTCPTSARIWN